MAPMQKPAVDASLYQHLPQSDIETRLKDLPAWKQDGTSIVRSQTFHTYLDALKFINKVGFAAEEHNHHPTIIMNIKRVEVRFWSRKVQGLTDHDFKMARIVDTFVGPSESSPT